MILSDGVLVNELIKSELGVVSQLVKWLFRLPKTAIVAVLAQSAAGSVAPIDSVVSRVFLCESSSGSHSGRASGPY